MLHITVLTDIMTHFVATINTFAVYLWMTQTKN